MSQKAASTFLPLATKGHLQRQLLADLVTAVTQGSQALPGGVSLRVWKAYVHVWLVCLIFPIIALMQLHPDMPHLILAAAGLVSFVVFYSWFMRQHPLDRPVEPGAYETVALIAICLATLLGISLSFMFSAAFLWLFVGTSMVAGRILPLRSAHLVATTLPFLTIAIVVILSGSITQTDWLHILPLGLLVRAMGLNMLGLTLQFRAIRDLRTAQAELARKAAVEERLRLARDLHDLLGHTLSLIVLKSELVGRLLEKQPESASKEIQELEAVARQALREVRQAITEFRRPTLFGELDGARQMLEAAGIAFTVENAAELLPAAIENVLSWVVREGVTNVIRHSHARQCTIRLTCDEQLVRVEITNDGLVEQSNECFKAGSGLSGLTERVTAQGGSLMVGPVTDDPSAFRLCAELPMMSR